MDWSGRAILHVDMDAFFTSIEQRNHPELRGQPVLVGGTGTRSVVAAASYEARRYGCRSAMPMAVAKRLCPQAVIVSGRHSGYAEVSAQIFSLLDRVTPLVQPVSVDEAYLDVTGSIRLLGHPAEIARSVREQIRRELSLTASVGVAPNKLVAKIASDLDKPDGLTIITQDRVSTVLDPLMIARIPGIGPRAVQTLNGLGVHTIGDLRRVPVHVLSSAFGSYGVDLARKARGEDDRPVRIERTAKSICKEETFPHDLSNPDDVVRVLLWQSEHVARRLRRALCIAAGVTVKIRFGEFQTITRSRMLAEPADTTSAIYATARSLFREWSSSSFRPVRLVGVTATHLTNEQQFSLFPHSNQDKIRTAEIATDAIVKKYGKTAIRRAATLDPDSGILPVDRETT